MADESEHQPTVAAHRIFEGTYCESIAYTFKTKKEDFDSAAFEIATGGGPEKHFVTCAPQNPESDYHLHVSWRTLHIVELRVEFVSGAKNPAPDEREPYAEQFMEWVEKFFIAKTPDSHIYSVFEFPSGIRQSKFLLPLKAVFGPAGIEVEIDGISFKLKPESEGVKKVWLTQEATALSVHIAADRRLDLKNFDPRNEIKAFASVLDSILEEKK